MSSPMFRHDAFEGRAFEPVSPLYVRTQHGVIDEIAPIIAKPLPDRRDEALLLAIDDVRRHIAMREAS